MDGTTQGHWTVNGFAACESPLTVGVMYDCADGGKRYTVCLTNYADFLRMEKAVLAEHPDADIKFIKGNCRKEGAYD